MKFNAEQRLQKLIKVHGTNSVSFQWRTLYCGKDCHGCPHGKYVYAKWRDGAKVNSLYLGKELPPLAKQIYRKKNK